MKAQEYLERFFEEKELPEELFFEIPARHISFPEDFILKTSKVIEAIKNASPKEQNKIVATLRRIDYANGDVADYMTFLAKAMIKTQQDAILAALKNPTPDPIYGSAIV